VNRWAESFQAAGFPLRSAATTVEIKATERLLGVPIPAVLRDLYLAANGFDPIPYDPESEASIDGVFRLMSLSEVEEIHPGLAEWGWNTAERICLFTNDNSDFLAFCVSGPLKGKVLLLAHDAPDFSPVWRNTESCLEAILAVGKKGFPDPFTISGADYPQLAPGSLAEATADNEVIALLRQRLESETGEQRRQDISYQIISLTPFEQTADLLLFLRSEDDYIQEKACQVLGKRRYAAAIPKLAEMAKTGFGNAPGAAVSALSMIQTPEALAVLLEMIETIPPQKVSRITFMNALQEFGVTFHENRRGELFYQLPDEEPEPFRFEGIDNRTRNKLPLP
jgi:hypothetical protein